MAKGCIYISMGLTFSSIKAPTLLMSHNGRSLFNSHKYYQDIPVRPRRAVLVSVRGKFHLSIRPEAY